MAGATFSDSKIEHQDIQSLSTSCQELRLAQLRLFLTGESSAIQPDLIRKLRREIETRVDALHGLTQEKKRSPEFSLTLSALESGTRVLDYLTIIAEGRESRDTQPSVSRSHVLELWRNRRTALRQAVEDDCERLRNADKGLQALGFRVTEQADPCFAIIDQAKRMFAQMELIGLSHGLYVLVACADQVPEAFTERHIELERLLAGASLMSTIPNYVISDDDLIAFDRGRALLAEWLRDFPASFPQDVLERLASWCNAIDIVKALQ